MNTIINNFNLHQQNDDNIETQRPEFENKNNFPWRWVLIFALIIIGFIFSYLSNPDTNFFDVLFWPVALLWSGFLGVFAFQIHQTGTDYEKVPWVVGVHQFIFNFGCAFIGWVIIAELQPIEINSIEQTQVILLIIAGISLTGYLPKVITLFKS